MKRIVTNASIAFTVLIVITAGVAVGGLSAPPQSGTGGHPTTPQSVQDSIHANQDPTIPLPPNSSVNSSENSTGQPSKVTFDLADVSASSIAGSPESSSQTIEVLIVVEPGQKQEVAKSIQSRNGSVQGSYENAIKAEVTTEAISGLAAREDVTQIRQPTDPVRLGNISEGVSKMRATDLHDAGITGENATIAVIDARFNPDNEKIRNQVVATKNFGGPGFLNGTDGLHGTATAEITADVAPDANLILISVGDELDFIEAVDWIDQETDTDVVTMSLGWSPVVGPLDGSDIISQRINESVQNGALWVTSAGNQGEIYLIDRGYAGRHWHGEWTPHPNQTVHEDNPLMDFNTSTEYLLQFDNLGGGNILVSWDANWETDNQRYAVHLYGEDPNGNIEWVKSSETTTPVENIPVNGDYYDPLWIAIEKVDADGNQDFDVHTRGNIFVSEGYTVNRSLLIPATSNDTVTVGAVDVTDDQLTRYSSRGPTVDGRQGVSIVAPTNIQNNTISPFHGTSAAAPHVAGAAGLLVASNESLGPAEIRAAIATSGRDISGDEATISSNLWRTSIGEGHIDARHAYTSTTVEVSYRVNRTLTTTEIPTKVTATINNSGGANATVPVEIYANGELVEKQSVTVEAYDNTTISKSISFANTGTFNVSVDQLTSTEIQVQDQLTKHVAIHDQSYPLGTDSVMVANATYHVNPFAIAVFNTSQDQQSILGWTNVSKGTNQGISVKLTEEVSSNISVEAMLYNDYQGDPMEKNSEQVSDTANITITESGPEVLDGSPATDIDGDGIYEDVNGDGTSNIVDVSAFFQNYKGQAVQNNVASFDFNGDGEISIVDVSSLFQASQA